MIPNPLDAVDRLRSLQRDIRSVVHRSHGQDLSSVSRSSAADTIYAIDTEVEPLLEDFCRDWARTCPLVLVAEGLLDDHGHEAPKVFPEGTRQEDAPLRLIVDPIDGTRMIMHDKRSAWALAGLAPNKGPHTRLRDIEVSVMTELPTSKMGFSDVLYAIRGQGAHALRESLDGHSSTPLPLRPSQATSIAHGFASVSNFFPGTKVLASQLMEFLAEKCLGTADVTKAMVFDDQYISTGGQFYELIIGHDRFNADLRPVFYAAQGQSAGLCCHPYDCAALLIAEEAGVLITDEHARPLDAPLDTTSPVSFLAYSNPSLRSHLEPLIQKFLASLQR